MNLRTHLPRGTPVLRAVLWAMLASGCAPWAWAQALAPNVAGIYSCIDAQGRRLTADRPIPQCIDREQRELSPLGTVRRVIGPTLTEYERTALEVQRRKEQEERAQQAEERRRERALLARYPSQATHDAERTEAIVQLDLVSVAASKRIQDLQEQRKALDLEMEFYRRDPIKAPMSLRRMLAENEASMLEQQRFIANQDREKRRVHQRFDLELAQLRQLWATQRAPLLPPSTQAGVLPLAPTVPAGAVYMTPRPLATLP